LHFKAPVIPAYLVASNDHVGLRVAAIMPLVAEGLHLMVEAMFSKYM
jgi:hypothetical protein